MKVKLHIQLLAALIIIFCLAISKPLTAQSLIVNGNFSAGISTDWENRDSDGITTYSDESGALQAIITGTPSNWYTTGIVSSVNNNSITFGQTVKVEFRAETNNSSAQVRLAISSPTLNKTFYQDVILNAGSGFQKYVIELTNTYADATDFQFNFFFLSAGTFKIDDIEVDIYSLGTNIASSATITAEQTNGGTPGSLADGDIAEWSGWFANIGTPIWVDITWASPQTVNRVGLFTIGTQPDYVLSDYMVQYWDGSAFQNIATVAGNTNSPSVTKFNDVTTTVLRILCTGTGSGGQYRIDEIIVNQQSSLSVEDFNYKDNFSIFTNSDGIIVKAIKQPLKKLQIYSITGELVYDEKTNQKEGNSIRVLTDRFSRGVYIMRINNKFIKKIIL